MPSPDTLGRICDLVRAEGVRNLLQDLYARLKRQKALDPPAHGLMALTLDGHETHATFHRHCDGCLSRTIHTAKGDRIQYYHRLVVAQLSARDYCLLLDAEPIRPGEDEVGVGIRLLERLIIAYPRAFEVVRGDALYADSRFFNWALQHGKDALAVLKDDRRDLLTDARALFEQAPAVVMEDGRYRCWDIAGFTTWPQVKQPVRVVRSQETRTVHRQLDDQDEVQTSDWIWVTTLSPHRAPTRAVVQLGHARWGIENQGFNELVNRWYADHVYKHSSNAMLVFWLMAMVSLNLFLTFYHRNLKPAARKAASMLHISRLIAAELYLGWREGPARAPP